MKEHNWFKDEKISYWNHNLDKVLTEKNKNCQESSYIWYINASPKGRQIEWQNLIWKPFLHSSSPSLSLSVSSSSFLLFFLTLICIVFSNKYFSEFPTAEDDCWTSWRFDAYSYDCDWQPDVFSFNHFLIDLLINYWIMLFVYRCKCKYVSFLFVVI